MPKRLDVIQKLIENSCAIKRAGVPDIKLTPEFYSFDFKDGVKFHSNASMASVNNPDYILSFMKGPYDWESKTSQELVSIVDVRGYVEDKIEVDNIIITDISLYETNRMSITQVTGPLISLHSGPPISFVTGPKKKLYFAGHSAGLPF